MIGRSVLVFVYLLISAGFGLGWLYYSSGQPHSEYAPDPPDTVPAFVEAGCWFENYWIPFRPNTDCGWLFVPARRDRDGGGAYALPVVILRATEPDPAPDPLILLGGGPGGAVVLPDYIDWWAALFEPVRRRRDVILFDQRGTGYAEPGLDCWFFNVEYQDAWPRPVSHAVELAEDERTLRDCRAAIGKADIDIGAFTLIEMARDVEDLRRALDLGQVNLLGVSYGGRVALTAMRLTPGGLRSVVLDSPTPPEVRSFAGMPAKISDAFGRVFAECLRQPACNAAFPDLEQRFLQVYQAFNRSPQPLEIRSGGAGRSEQIFVTGDRLANFLYARMYAADELAGIPALIHDLARGRVASLRATIESDWGGSTGDDSDALYVSIRCSDEAAATDWAALDRGAGDLAPYAHLADLGHWGRVCGFWGARDLPEAARAPVESDIPTLILAGRFDPITPPAQARGAAERLANGHYVEFADLAHGVFMDDACARMVTAEFLDRTRDAPGHDCLREARALEFATD